VELIAPIFRVKQSWIWREYTAPKHRWLYHLSRRKVVGDLKFHQHLCENMKSLASFCCWLEVAYELQVVRTLVKLGEEAEDALSLVVIVTLHILYNCAVKCRRKLWHWLYTYFKGSIIDWKQSTFFFIVCCGKSLFLPVSKYEGWNFNSGNYLFTTDTK